MFPPFSLDPIGFSVVGPMGTFFAPFHFTFLRARFASVFAKASTRQAAQSRKRVPSFFALASLPSSLNLRRTGRSVPTPSGRVPGFSFLILVDCFIFSETCQKPHKLACGMNGILLEQGFLGDGESPNHRVPPHRGGRRLPQKPPSLLGGSSLSSLSLQLQIGNANCPMKVQCSMYYLTI